MDQTILRYGDFTCIACTNCKFHEAKVNNAPFVEIWGTGTPRREFLYVDDMADACVYLMVKHSFRDIGTFVNIGWGQDISIAELANLIKDIVGYEGELVFNTKKPDGTPRKLLDVSRLHGLGWKATTNIRDGIRTSYEWFKNNFRS